MKNLILFAIALSLSPSAQSQNLAGAAKASLQGLCIEENQNQNLVERGWCKAIFETIGGNKSEPIAAGCTDDLFQKVFKKAKKDGIAQVHECKDEFKTQAKFNDVFAQYVAATIEVATSWGKEPQDTASKGKVEPSRGFLTLDPNKLGEYKCGCSGIDPKNKVTHYHGNTVSKCVTYVMMKKILDEPTQAEKTQNKSEFQRLSAVFGNKFDGEPGRKLGDKVHEKLAEFCKKRNNGGARPLEHTLEEDGRTTVQ